MTTDDPMPKYLPVVTAGGEKQIHAMGGVLSIEDHRVEGTRNYILTARISDNDFKRISICKFYEPRSFRVAAAWLLDSSDNSVTSRDVDEAVAIFKTTAGYAFDYAILSTWEFVAHRAAEATPDKGYDVIEERIPWDEDEECSGVCAFFWYSDDRDWSLGPGSGKTNADPFDYEITSGDLSFTAEQIVNGEADGVLTVIRGKTFV